jgi:hypothetical protein
MDLLDLLDLTREWTSRFPAEPSSKRHFTLEALEPRHCRFPIGDPLEPTFRCDAARGNGGPCCGEHSRVAYQTLEQYRAWKAPLAAQRAAQKRKRR